MNCLVNFNIVKMNKGHCIEFSAELLKIILCRIHGTNGTIFRQGPIQNRMSWIENLAESKQKNIN